MVPRIDFAIFTVFLYLTIGKFATAQCSLGCVNCNTSKPSDGCTLCDVDYILTTSKTCTKCPLIQQGCAFCASSTKCRLCTEGYILSFKTKKCLKCSSLIPGCQQCVGTAEKPSCTLCMDGYVYNTDKNSCQKCPQNCNFCELTNGAVGGKCMECRSGYAPTTDGKCVKGCPAKCERCYAPNKCEACAFGEGLFVSANNSSCVSCGKQCSACKRATQCDTVRKTRFIFNWM